MELTKSITKINDLEYQNKLLKEKLNDSTKPVDFKKKKVIQ